MGSQCKWWMVRPHGRYHEDSDPMEGHDGAQLKSFTHKSGGGNEKAPSLSVL